MVSRSNPLLRIRHRIEQGFYWLGRTLFRLLPEKPVLRLGPWLGYLGFHLDRRHRRVALDNLTLAYPQLEREKRDVLAHRCFESFGSLLATVLAWSKLDEKSFSERFEVEGWHHLEAAEAHGQGILLLTGHLGNWEALAQYLALIGRPVWFVARPVDNPFIERDLRQLRERFGNHSIPKRKAARGALKVLRARGRVGILMDQRVHPAEGGKAFPFFGSPAYTTTMPARLSLHTGAPAVPIFGIPIDSWQRCRIVIHPPIVPNSDGSPTERAVNQLTTRYMTVIEETIRRNPQLWLWMHRKWRQYPYEELTDDLSTTLPSAAAIQSPAPTEALSRSSRRV